MVKNKIDKRRSYYLVLDTETVKINHKNIIYDLGYVIVDKNGVTLKRYNRLINEVFFNRHEYFSKDYFNKYKIFKYYEMLENKEITSETFANVLNDINHDIINYNVKYVSIHNANYDINALKATCNLLQVKPFINHNIKILDTYVMSLDTICTYKTYLYKSAKGKPSAKAENLYKYITNNPDFIESHTALSDSEIEAVILVKILKSHKKHRNTFKNKTYL